MAETGYQHHGRPRMLNFLLSEDGDKLVSELGFGLLLENSVRIFAWVPVPVTAEIWTPVPAASGILS